MLYKGLKDAASIPTNDLLPPIRRTRNHHSLAFQTPFAEIVIFKSAFFPQTISGWNSRTDSLISASECAKDSVTKFTSLWRAFSSPDHRSWWMIVFGRITSKQFWFWVRMWPYKLFWLLGTHLHPPPTTAIPTSVMGWSDGAKVLGKLSVPGRPTRLDDSRARAYCVCSRCGWGFVWTFFSLIYLFSFLPPSLWETARYRLKYCLKGPLNPKQPTNRPPLHQTYHFIFYYQKDFGMDIHTFVADRVLSGGERACVCGGRVYIVQDWNLFRKSLGSMLEYF